MLREVRHSKWGYQPRLVSADGVLRVSSLMWWGAASNGHISHIRRENPWVSIG